MCQIPYLVQGNLIQNTPHIFEQLSQIPTLASLIPMPLKQTNDLGMRLHLGPLQPVLEQWGIMTGTECHKILKTLTLLIQNSDTLPPPVLS